MIRRQVSTASFPIMYVSVACMIDFKIAIHYYQRHDSIYVTRFGESLQELLRQDAAVVLDVNGLEDAVEVELLLVHVASELEVVNTTIPIGIAYLKEVPGIPVLGGDAHGGEAGLDLGVIKVAQSGGVEEVEKTTDAGLTLLSSLPKGEKNVVHGDRTGLLRRGALVGIHLLMDGGEFYEAGVRSHSPAPGMACRSII